MAAQFVDALIGYDFYLSKRGKASIKDVNNYLISQNRSPIKQRTYGHYRKLLLNGFRSYIPINKFDVFQALGNIQMAADRRRYEREDVRIQILFSNDGNKWFNGTIVNRSLVGFGIQTQDKCSIKRGKYIFLKMDGFYDIPAVVVWITQHEGIIKFGVRAFEFIAKYQKFEDSSIDLRLTGIIRITYQKSGILKWEDVNRIVEKTNLLLDSVTELFYTLNDILETNLKIPRPILVFIKFGSPGGVEIKVDFGIADVIKIVLEKFQFWGLEKKRYREENRKLELENQNLEIELLRNVINLRKEMPGVDFIDAIVDNITDKIKKIFKVDKLPADFFGEESLEKSILQKRIIPSAIELAAGDDTDVEIISSKQ